MLHGLIAKFELRNPKSPMKLIPIVGARPQFIKAAVFSRAIRAHAGQVIPRENMHLMRDSAGGFG